MIRLISLTFKILLSLIIAIVLACTIAVKFYNFESLKPAITDQFYKTTGLKLSIKSDANVSIFPRAAITLRDITAKNKNESLFANTNSITSTISLSSFIHGKIIADSFSVNNMTISYINNTDQYSTIYFEDLSGNITTTDQQIKLSNVVANVFEGKCAGDLTFSKQPGPTLTIQSKFTDININNMLNSLSKYNKLYGTGTIYANLSANLKTGQSITKSLNGKIRFRFNDGLFDGTDISKYYSKGISLITHDKLETESGLIQTKFDSLSGTAIIENGILMIDDLLITSGDIKITGHGTIKLDSHAITFFLNASSSNKAKILGQLLGNISVPIKITNTIDNPHFNINAKILTGTIKIYIPDKSKNDIKKEANQLVKKLTTEFLKK